MGPGSPKRPSGRPPERAVFGAEGQKFPLSPTKSKEPRDCANSPGPW